jgi:Domain of unknown function (DUF5655)
MLPVLAATARRQGSQLAAKNSANSALCWLTPVNPLVPRNAYLDVKPGTMETSPWMLVTVQLRGAEGGSMPGPWPVASHDSDFDPYLAGMPAASVQMFRRFVDMARASGPVIFELQDGPIVLRGTRRIFAGVRVLDRGLRGRLNMMRRVEDPRLVKAEANAKTLLSYHYSVTAMSDLDDEFQRWLDEAHAVGDGAHLLR